MYAVIETGGKQYRVQPGEQIRVERDTDSKVQRKVLIEHKGELHPQIIIEDDAGKILDFYYLPEDQWTVLAGDDGALTAAWT